MKISGDAFDRARRVQLIIFDVDGVLTDGGIYHGADKLTVLPVIDDNNFPVGMIHLTDLLRQGVV